MERIKIYKFKETDNIEVANKLIEQNWVPIREYTVAKYSDAPNNLKLIYVFGITKEDYANYDESVIKDIENPYAELGW